MFYTPIPTFLYATPGLLLPLREARGKVGMGGSYSRAMRIPVNQNRAGASWAHQAGNVICLEGLIP